MRRPVFWSLLVIVLVVISCGAGVRFAVQPQIVTFLVPGAVDVQVVELGPGQRRITYQMQNPAAGWYSMLARRLKNSGWTPPDVFYVWGSTENYNNIYTRHWHFWRMDLWEQATLEGNPRSARITVRRWLSYE